MVVGSTVLAAIPVFIGLE